MRYDVENNELVIIDGDITSHLTALDVYKNEQDSSTSLSLSDVGLWFNESMASVRARLEKSETSPFGIIWLYAKDSYGQEAQLSPNHASDHIVIKDSLVPLHKADLEDTLEKLSSCGADPGKDLTLAAYLNCVKNFETEQWISFDWELDAKNWIKSDALINEVRDPISFRAQLADYQVEGSSWLTMMIEQGVGAILGDGMGLGKTVQMIKAICDLLEMKPDARILIVCPSALVENWRREIAKFTIGLDVQIHMGQDRSRNYRDLHAPIIITTYDAVRIDTVVLSQIKWGLLVLDEAQYIKNPDSQRTRSVKSLPYDTGIAVTGTPFENHMTDVWSLMDFCCPGYLGNKSSFISKYQDEEFSALSLGKIIAPLLLRRKLSDIPNDLPDLIKIPMPISLLPEEAREYERRKLEYKAQGAVLGSIQNLIGDLSSPKGADSHLSNLKFDYLKSVAEEAFGNGEKIIVFTNRMQCIDYLAKEYSAIAPVFCLTGSTSATERVPLVDKFSEIEGAALLLCNPTVGGAGLNITAANHVFHLSPQWNPAIIDQADARAHRRGQNKTVIAHYPYYASTIEEYMWNKVLEKRDLSSLVSVGNKGLRPSEIEEALNMSPVENE